MAIFDPNEHPGLLMRYRHGLNLALLAALGLVSGPGYAVYLMDAPVPITSWQQALLQKCGTCLERYNDLQAFDGISGNVYIVTASLFVVTAMTCFGYLLWVYVSAWRASDSYFPLEKRQARLALWITLVPVGMIFVIIFMPTNLSDTIYPGNAQVLLGWGYPLLAAVGALVVALSLMQLTVVLMKLVRQKFRFN